MIGGNIELILKQIDAKNFDENGKKIISYKTIASLFGWLDLVSGDSKYDYKAKIENSTHVFICSYIELGNIDIENVIATVGNKNFEIQYIDNPMGLNEQLEIYLKLVGGQNGD